MGITKRKHCYCQKDTDIETEWYYLFFLLCCAHRGEQWYDKLISYRNFIPENVEKMPHSHTRDHTAKTKWGLNVYFEYTMMNLQCHNDGNLFPP